MADQEKPEKVELDQVMLAMDVVDLLRHEQALVERELASDERDQALFEQVKRMYASQGLEVTDEIIADGVAALREERFVYRPPPPKGSLWLARLYVNRRRWAIAAGIVAASLVAVVFIYQFAFVMPEVRQRVKTTQDLTSLRENLTMMRQSLMAESREEAARRQAENLYADALRELNRGDVQGARKGLTALEELYGRVIQEYDLRITSRPGAPSGVWRQPPSRPGVRNYYVIVEAVTPKGELVTVPITSEEDGATRSVSQWGLRVEEALFERIRRDKADDGIIQNNRFGVKARGFLSPHYLMPTTGGAITQW